MSCPKCGNTVIYSLGDDPVGISRCGKCGARFSDAEAGNLDSLREIIERLDRIERGINKLGKRFFSEWEAIK